MKQLRAYWQIEKTWQYLWLIIGVAALVYVGYKLANLIIPVLSTPVYNYAILTVVTIIIAYALLKITLKIFDKVEQRWQVQYRWEMIVIFIVFSITGSTSVMIGRPILKAIGLNTENLPAILYWPLFILASFIFYQVFLVSFGWLFGQHAFFWNMEKKMLKRFRILK